MHRPLIKRSEVVAYVIQAILFVCDRTRANTVYRVRMKHLLNLSFVNNIVIVIKVIFLSGGIFLLLGYSSIDESLLRSYTNLGIPDTVRAFQQYLQRHIDNQVRIQHSITLDMK